MSEQLRASRMSSLERWRAQAFALGAPLGHLLSRTYDVIQTVVRDGVRDEMNVSYALESLAAERAIAMRRDAARDEPINESIYSLTESFGAMVESIMEEIRGPAGAPGLHQWNPERDSLFSLSPKMEGTPVLFPATPVSVDNQEASLWHE